jgi:hypothetical protein
LIALVTTLFSRICVQGMTKKVRQAGFICLRHYAMLCIAGIETTGAALTFAITSVTKDDTVRRVAVEGGSATQIHLTGLTSQ